MFPATQSFAPASMNNVQFLLQKLVYFPMRNFNPMPLRPYTFAVQSDAMDTLVRRMQETNSGKITADMLSGVTSGIVTPSAVPYTSAIDHSWVGQRRYLFMMKVSHVDYMGTEINSYFFGYTEFDGISTAQSHANMDMNMVHYVNNVIETATHVFQTPMGTVRNEKLLQIYNTIYNQQGFGSHSVYTQRPTDLYNALQANEIASVMQGIDVQPHFVSGMIAPFSNNVVASTTENNISTEYLSRLLTGGIHAVKNKEIHVNSYEIAEDVSSARHFQEANMGETAFIRYLSRIAGYSTSQPMFTMGHLMRIDPTIYDRFEVFNLTSDFSSPILSATPETGEFWHGQDIVTTKAHSLLENCVALATKYGFQKLSFSATNMAGPAMGTQMGILDFNSFLSVSQQDFSYLLEIFKDKFNLEIFLNETNSGTLPLTMECHIDLLGASKIYLEFAGFHGKWYTAPTFANSLYSPVVTMGDETLSIAASHIGSIVNTLMDAQPMYTF